MAEYNQRLNQIRNQYNNQNLPQGAFFTSKPASETMNCHQITRNVYIFKPSI